MTKHRAAIALSAAALVVAVLGQTAVGQAAANVVRVALFAENSARVNNIKASRTPMPGRLLALNAKGQFPSSVIAAPTTSSARGGGSYTRTIVVHPDPDATKAGSALIRAVAGIAGNSASNTYLIKIEPGVFDLVTGSLVMKPYVDIEGSGEGVTTITSADASGTGTVVAANNTELRHLTVKNNGSGQQSVAIFAQTASPRITHVTASASGSSENYGLHISNGSSVLTNVTATASSGVTAIALANLGGATSASNSSFSASDSPSGLVAAVLTASGGAMKLQNSTLTASGGSIAMGFRAYNSSQMLTNVTISASGSGESYGINSGWKTQTPSVQVHGSRVSGQTNSVYAVGGFVRLGASQLSGPVGTLNAGTLACVASYDASFSPRGPDCN